MDGSPACFDNWCGQRSRTGRFPTVLINLLRLFREPSKTRPSTLRARLKRSEPFLAKRRSHPHSRRRRDRLGLGQGAPGGGDAVEHHDHGSRHRYRALRAEPAGLLRRPGHVLCRQLEGRQPRLPTDVHRHLRRCSSTSFTSSWCSTGAGNSPSSISLPRIISRISSAVMSPRNRSAFGSATASFMARHRIKLLVLVEIVWHYSRQPSRRTMLCGLLYIFFANRTLVFRLLGDRVLGAGDIDHAHAGRCSINTRADRFAAMAKASVREFGTRVPPSLRVSYSITDFENDPAQI